jgi:hypothetical protein
MSKKRIFSLLLVITMVLTMSACGETKVGKQKVEKTTAEQEKTDDATALKKLIAEQKALGATVSEDVDSEEYEWDEDGNLIDIYWDDCSLSGDISFADFEKLAYLDCAANELSKLDISHNTALTLLDCQENNLSELDVSQNTLLTEFRCWENNLSELDVSKNTLLTQLYCDSNKLSTLDVSCNTQLRDLICYDNNLSELDLSQNTMLSRLNCDDKVNVTGYSK